MDGTDMTTNKKDSKFWKDTDTWRKEPDFWRKGVMKKLPVLASLSFVMLVGVILTLILK
tara:strand:+ start:133 stop:309 length:177 start_codon:yes stop_codon:yes gene_type:complete